MSSALFDLLPDIYDSLVDWPKRLAHEGPFYRELFERVGADRILDAACGTGRHAALFHSWNKRVEGADISPKMIERARRLHGESDGLRWVVRGFEDPIDAEPPFDAAICVGNSLALAPDLPAVERTVQNLLGAVRSGGVVVLHVLNLWRLPDGPTVWQKVALKEMPAGRVAIAKGVHRVADRGFVDLLVVPVAPETEPLTQCVSFLGLHAAQLRETARRAGARSIRLLGGYRDEPYDPESSVDLLLVAEK